MLCDHRRQKHQEKVANPIFVYKKEEDKMTLIQTFPSGRYLGKSIGKSEKLFSNTKISTGGWYRNILYFTETELENVKKDIISLLEFKEIMDSLELTRIGFGVRVTDIVTGQVTEYDSMRAVTRDIGIDNKGIKDKSSTGKLYKKR